MTYDPLLSIHLGSDQLYTGGAQISVHTIYLTFEFLRAIVLCKLLKDGVILKDGAILMETI
jgi:hypothetical protein